MNLMNREVTNYAPVKRIDKMDTVTLVSQWTAFIMYALLVFAGTWDLIISWRFGTEYSISRVVWHYSTQFPILPLLAGIILGHLLWPQHLGR